MAAIQLRPTGFVSGGTSFENVENFSDKPRTKGMA
jgi:hypothetical protein